MHNNSINPYYRPIIIFFKILLPECLSSYYPSFTITCHNGTISNTAWYHRKSASLTLPLVREFSVDRRCQHPKHSQNDAYETLFIFNRCNSFLCIDRRHIPFRKTFNLDNYK